MPKHFQRDPEGRKGGCGRRKRSASQTVVLLPPQTPCLMHPMPWETPQPYCTREAKHQLPAVCFANTFFRDNSPAGGSPSRTALWVSGRQQLLIALLECRESCPTAAETPKSSSGWCGTEQGSTLGYPGGLAPFRGVTSIMKALSSMISDELSRFRSFPSTCLMLLKPKAAREPTKCLHQVSRGGCSGHPPARSILPTRRPLQSFSPSPYQPSGSPRSSV